MEQLTQLSDKLVSSYPHDDTSRAVRTNDNLSQRYSVLHTGYIIIYYLLKSNFLLFQKKRKEKEQEQKNIKEQNPQKLIQLLCSGQSERKRKSLKCSDELAAQFRPITGQVHGLAIGHGIGTGIART